MAESENKSKNGKNGKVAMITAVGGILVALSSSGYLHVNGASDENLNQAYLRLREARVEDNARINKLVRELNRLQGQVQILTSLSVTHRPAHAHAPPRARGHVTVHQPAPAPAVVEPYLVREIEEVDEIDVLYELPVDLDGGDEETPE